MFFTVLETDRLFLKNISTHDREFILEQFSNDQINRYLFDAEPLHDLDDADEIIDFYTLPEPRAQHRWILIKKDDGTKIGTCGFHCWDISNQCCEVGYDLSPGDWGKGYMFEALSAICAFAKIHMNVKSIHACISVENTGSLKLAGKLGFVFHGEMKDEIFRGERYAHKVLTLDCT